MPVCAGRRVAAPCGAPARPRRRSPRARWNRRQRYDHFCSTLDISQLTKAIQDIAAKVRSASIVLTRW